MSALRALAPAKVNLGLFLGPLRAADARHELVSVMQSISLADEVTLEPAPRRGRGRRRARVPRRPARARREPRRGRAARLPRAHGLGCAGAADHGAQADPARRGARRRLRRRGRGAAPRRARLAARGRAAAARDRLRARRGRPRAGRAGALARERRRRAARAAARAEPAARGARAAARERSCPPRGCTPRRTGSASRVRARELAERREELAGALALGAPLPAAGELLHNDLQRAAVSLCPEIAGTLELVRSAGAQLRLVSGSGPTVIGLFAAAASGARPPGSPRERGGGDLERVAAALAERVPTPIFASASSASSRTPGPRTTGACVTMRATADEPDRRSTTSWQRAP